MHSIQILGLLAVLYGYFPNGFADVIALNNTNITPKQLQVSAQQSVPRDYFLFQDSYYKYHKSPQNWAEARRICEAEGGSLTIVNSEDEAYFLVRLMRQYPAVILDDVTCNRDYIYIGFHSLFQAGEFVTIDGKSIRYSGYVHWAPGEPYNAGGSEYCGSFYRYGGLNDLGCWCRGPFVCEIPVNPCAETRLQKVSENVEVQAVKQGK